VLGTLGWRGVFPVFFALMAAALLAVALLKVEETRPEQPPSVASSLGLLKQPTFALAVLGIFLYVGAEVCLARFLKPTLAGFGLAGDRAALLGPTLFFASLTTGRLLGSGVLRFVGPRPFFVLSAFLGLLGTLALTLNIPWLALVGVVLAGLGFANIWPLLFALTVEERPERSSELSGLMCMAISGGALLPLLMGRLLDGGLAGLAYLVPAAAFVYLLLLALRGRREA
jgi:fucose permease